MRRNCAMSFRKLVTQFSRRKTIDYYLVTKRHNHQRVFSGIQPTGIPHLGNYFGAIQNWIKLQDSKPCIFCIVDLHSITLPQDPRTLRENIHLMTASLLACGIDPDKSILFLQSQVTQHAELCWILCCLSTMARLMHLPQYKEKSSQMKDVPLGLYMYPILQCADILLYKATEVPVGSDQVQHIQLTQHLARIFNNRFKKIFPVPEIVLHETCEKLKSLRQPDKKMSKSDLDEKSRINLNDAPDTILSKIKKSLTDLKSEVSFDLENRPGVSNLILMHSLCTGISPSSICQQFQAIDTGQYKLVVAESVIEHLKPVQLKFNEYLANPEYLENVIKDGSNKAADIACGTMVDVKESVGLSPFSAHMC